MANVIVISGANGAGKSTLAPHLLRDTFGITEYVNADTIALGLSAFAPEQAAMEAGRIMLKRLDELAKSGKDFAFETTLASRSYVRRLKALQPRGYKVSLIFLWLSDADLAVSRVIERVKVGGHDVPEAVIRRRYKRGLENFFNIYQSFIDAWVIYDCSSADKLLAIASGGINLQTEIHEREKWKTIQPTI